MFERFSGAARDIVHRAQLEAARRGHDWMGTEHLLLALARDPDGVPARVLAAVGLSHAELEEAVTGLVRPCSAQGSPRPDREALAGLGIELDAVRGAAEEAFGSGALERTCAWQRAAGARRLTPWVKRTFELARKESGPGDGGVLPEDLLLAIARGRESVGASLLAGRGLSYSRLRVLLGRQGRRAG